MNILIGFCPDCRGIKISTPYALKKNKTNFAILDSLHGDYGDVFTMSKIFRPYLYSMEMLTQEIEHNGERFVPSEILPFDFTDLSDFDYNYVPYNLVEFMLEHHFNVFGLEELEYIKKETL